MLDFVKSLSRRAKQTILLALDLVLVPASYYGTMLLLDGRLLPLSWFAENAARLLLLTLIAGGLSILLGLPRIQLKSYEISAMGRSALLALALAAALVVINGNSALPQANGVPVIFAMLFLVLGAVSRLILLRFLLFLYRREVPATRVLIYGAGTTGMQLALALKTHAAIRAVGFIDDNTVLHNITVAGLPVHAPQRLEALIRELSVDRVLLAMPSLSAPRQAQIARRVADMGVEVQALPSFAQLVGQEEIIGKLTPVLPQAFLGRARLDETLKAGCDAYVGRTVMITGAGGSIGSELGRQVLGCKPARLVLLELSEFALYTIERELSALAEGGCEIIPVLGSVTDARKLRETLRRHGVQVVLHAAAYKHVPLVEANPESGVSNNVFGTLTVAQEAMAAEVERFILISTDKAVRPNGLMGATKRLAEILIGDMARRSPSTVFAMVRFGNVLGSSGSVIPLFQEQILNGGPLTLTHEAVTRFFMTVQEATQLVLLAGNLARGGEIFVLDMGQPVRIADLARQVIESSGYTVRDRANPDGDIEIVVTGLRPGEKLHEELSISERLQKTAHPKLFRAQEGGLSQFEIARALHSLNALIEAGDGEALTEEAMRWVARDLEKAAQPAEGSGTAPPG